MATKQDKQEFRAYCRGCTDAQLRAVLIKETLAGRNAYVQIAKEIMQERGL